MNIDSTSPKPKEKGNAQIINDVCLPVIPFVMMRYEQISNIYTEGPDQVRIRLKDNDDFYSFEQVFRCIISIPNKEVNSWCIYSEDREWNSEEDSIGGLVIRHAVWDRALDVNIVQKPMEKDEREKVLRSWPSLKLKNIYINQKMASDIISRLHTIDKIIEKGIKLVNRKKTEPWPIWNNLEIKRLFDWGEVKSSWHPFKLNKDIEEYVIMLDKYLCSYIENISLEIYEMQLDYIVPPEIFKSLTIGNQYEKIEFTISMPKDEKSIV